MTMLAEHNGHTREIVFRPAYDKRSPEPNKNYGVHGAEMCWYLKGPEGAIQFVVFTNWHLPHVRAELEASRTSFEFPHLNCHPMGADIGYHARTPRYEGQSMMSDDCQIIGGPCYYDGSGLAAEELLTVLIEKGDEAVWIEMEEWYKAKLKT